MRLSKTAIITAAAAIVAAATAVDLVRAGGDKVAFPADYAKGVVYMTLDRPENKQVREYYTSQAAVDAAKKGAPLPNDTVITVVQYAAQLDPQGNPTKDANGRFSKTANEARRLGGGISRDHAQWRVGIPSLPRRQDGQPERQSHRLLQLPQAAGKAGLCVLLRQAQARGEVAVAP